MTTEHQAWSEASAQLARARVWLSTHDEPAVAATRTRSTAELHRRQAQLEAIFATAPPDHRRLIDAITTGQLTLDDMSQALDRALAAQDERRDWILEHWPHLVEHAEITRTLDTFTAGPDVGLLLDQLALLDVPGIDSTDPQALLAHAARTNQAWLRVVLSRLLPPDADHIASPTIELLGDVAAYRDRWRVTHPAPLGLAADTEEQARDLKDLAQKVDAALDADIDQQPGREQQPAVPQLGL